VNRVRLQQQCFGHSIDGDVIIVIGRTGRTLEAEEHHFGLSRACDAADTVANGLKQTACIEAVRPDAWHNADPN
jgi:hypothetical protein